MKFLNQITVPEHSLQSQYKQNFIVKIFKYLSRIINNALIKTFK